MVFKKIIIIGINEGFWNGKMVVFVIVVGRRY